MTESAKATRLTVAAFAFPAIFFASQTHAAAQSFKNDITFCQLPNPEDSIRNCSALLDTKMYGGKALGQIYYGRAAGYATLGKYEEAIADYSRMLVLLPGDADGWARRGMAYAMLKQDKLALADINKSVELNPDNPSVFHLRGCILVALGQYSAAIEDFDKALASHPDAVSWKYRSMALAGQGKYELAIVDLDKALALKPENATTLTALRCITRATIKEQLNEALADCQRNLKADPKSADALDSVSFAYFRMGNFDEARKYNERAITVKSDSYGLIFMRGVLKLQQGDTMGGNADIAAAKAADSDVASFYALYGISH